MKKPMKINEHVNRFDDYGRFIIADFDHKRPFSSFLPGIAGLHGIPMWVFYVNRGQAVCSFGVENKDHPILEFQAANKAYKNTGLDGFRTFITGTRDGKEWHRELFSPWNADDVQRKMFIGMNEVEIQEVNLKLGYQFNVLYFMLPSFPFSGLVRKIHLKNLQETPLSLELLDGLPTVVPYGVDNGALKNIGRTIEAWMQVDNVEEDLPFYRLKATPGDTAEVRAIRAGNYALAFNDDFLPVIADPSVIFGQDTGYSDAHLFYERGLKAVLDTAQTLEGRSLCAFFGDSTTIGPGEVWALTSIYGYSQLLSTVQSWAERLRSPAIMDQKLLEARRLTEDLTRAVRTQSAFQTFDGYSRQTFLDNFLRGGYPIVLGGQHITHVYSRKHGDIERDYNYFVIPPEYYSQGNGNYRDVNQNRRSDVFFLPQAGEFNIRMFMSLIQADGYNPLVINGLTFSVPKEHIQDLLVYADKKANLEKVLSRQFTPGEVFEAALEAETSIPAEHFMELVFSKAESHIQAGHGEGFWVDHWTYNLDLLDAYLGIFPDKKRDLLFHSDPLPFFDNSHVVQPREARFVLSQGEPRQLNAVVEDLEKKALIESRGEEPNWARADHGKGAIFRLPLVSKLVLLALIKYATLDPSGMGIQMEAGKPGWYDALNGLPGLFGSSMPETYELRRLISFLIQSFHETPQKCHLPVEAEILINAIEGLKENNPDTFTRWEKMTDALEAYREAIRLGFDGKRTLVEVGAILGKMQEDVDRGIKHAGSLTQDVPPTYIIHEVTDFNLKDTEDGNGNPHIQINDFKPVALPAFLEGPVRLMKLLDRDAAQDLAEAVKASDLFDQKLEMFKVNAPLENQSHEIGRARAFTPGWLENESVWMHMSFKYLWELQKAGLHEAFFEALKNHLPAFMDPDAYGRSPLENSSFIVSSAHPDESLHGNGFVARLSGSTAEFLSMWVGMTVGTHPFKLVDGHLALALKPALPGWLFKDGTFVFRFLDSCDVTLHNPLERDTYAEGMTIKRIELHSHGETIRFDGDVIPSPYAEKVRSGEVDRIDLFY